VGPKRAPDLAEHRDKILEELGYDGEDIAGLGSQGAFGIEGD
jgi:crotonobetainyl-CoA:carnitine CoA-transferase CaiB-like acyl-CoA transferase